jgi:hypothetical protein
MDLRGVMVIGRLLIPWWQDLPLSMQNRSPQASTYTSAAEVRLGRYTVM